MSQSSLKYPILKTYPSSLYDLIQDRNQGKGECAQDHTPCSPCRNKSKTQTPLSPSLAPLW